MFHFMWTSGRLAFIAVKANKDLNKEQKHQNNTTNSPLKKQNKKKWLARVNMDLLI